MKKGCFLSLALAVAMVATMLMGGLTVSAAPTMNSTILSKCDTSTGWAAKTWNNASATITSVLTQDANTKTEGSYSLKFSCDFAAIPADKEGSAYAEYSTSLYSARVSSVSVDVYPVNVNKVTFRLFDGYYEDFYRVFTVTPNTWNTLTMSPAAIGNGYTGGNTDNTVGVFDGPSIKLVQVLMDSYDLVAGTGTAETMYIDNLRYQTYSFSTTDYTLADGSTTTGLNKSCENGTVNSFTSDPTGGYDGGSCLSLSSTFGSTPTTNYDYASVSKTSLSEYATGISFRYKCDSNTNNLQVRLVDAGGETFQYTVAITKDGAWHQYTISQLSVNGASYGGTKNNVFDLPMKSLYIGFFRNQLATPLIQTTLLLDDIVISHYTGTTTTVAPANGATGVDCWTNFAVTYSQDMDTNTFTGITVKQGTTNVPFTGVYVSDMKKYVINFTSRLTPLTAYTVMLPSGIADTSGNVVNILPTQYTFTTGATSTLIKKLSDFEVATDLWKSYTYGASTKPTIAVSQDTTTAAAGSASQKVDFNFPAGASTGGGDVLMTYYSNVNDTVTGLKFNTKAVNVSKISVRVKDQSGEYFAFRVPVSANWQQIQLTDLSTTSPYFSYKSEGNNDTTVDQPIQAVEIGLEKSCVTDLTTAGTFWVDDYSQIVAATLADGAVISAAPVFSQDGAVISKVKSGNIKISAQVTNNSSSTVTPVLVAARVNNLGKLDSVQIFSQSIAPYTTNNATATLNVTDATSDIKAFVWNDMTNISPLGSSATLPSSPQLALLPTAMASITATNTKPVYYFLGSSTTAGDGNGGVSFVDYLTTGNNAIFVKDGIGGTTMAGTGTSTFVSRLKTYVTSGVHIDHFFCQISGNDISQSIPLGTVSESMNIADFDTSTTIGAMEYIVAYVKQTCNCPVTFFTSLKATSAYPTYPNLITAANDLQTKWGNDVIDFWNYTNMQALTDTTLGTYMADAVHPNAAGNKWMASIFSNYLAKVSQ